MDNLDNYTKEFAEKDSQRSLALAKVILQAATELKNLAVVREIN
jgi:hypothetical protein